MPIAWQAAREKLRQRVLKAPLLTQRLDTINKLVDPLDPKHDLETRARSYIHANCSFCHVAAGGGNAAMEMEIFIERAKANMFDVKPLHNTFGFPEPRIVAPGSPERSVLLERITRRGTGQMPPLSTSVVDREAVALIRAWIAQMPPEKPVEKASAATTAKPESKKK